MRDLMKITKALADENRIRVLLATKSERFSKSMRLGVKTKPKGELHEN